MSWMTAQSVWGYIYLLVFCAVPTRGFVTLSQISARRLLLANLFVSGELFG